MTTEYRPVRTADEFLAAVRETRNDPDRIDRLTDDYLASLAQRIEAAITKTGEPFEVRIR